MRLTCLTTALLLVSSLLLQSQTGDGGITGTVIDDQTQAPIAGAYIMAVETLNQNINNPPSAKTDSEGRFEITGLELHEYHVYASKTQDGYPNADPAYSDENQGTVMLTPDRPSASTVIRLRKAGILIVDVRDAMTGKPVSAHYKLSVARKWEVSGELLDPLLIHPLTDVMLEVSAKGYKTWSYSDPSNPARPLPLRLDPGEQRSLKVELEPEANNASTRH